MLHDIDCKYAVSERWVSARAGVDIRASGLPAPRMFVKHLLPHLSCQGLDKRNGKLLWSNGGSRSESLDESEVVDGLLSMSRRCRGSDMGTYSGKRGAWVPDINGFPRARKGPRRAGRRYLITLVEGVDLNFRGTLLTQRLFMP